MLTERITVPKKTRKMKERASQRKIHVPAAPAQPSAGAVESAPTRIAAPGAPVATPARTVTPARSGGPAPLTFDYTYVYRDLRRIAILAGSAFAILIILSFVIK
jgi:hypothetical protein